MRQRRTSPGYCWASAWMASVLVASACSSSTTWVEPPVGPGAPNLATSDVADSSSSGSSVAASPERPAATGSFSAVLRGEGSATVEVQGVGRAVALYVPATLASNAPLIVAYHGTGGTGQVMLGDLRITSLADQHGFVVVAPDAVKGRRGGSFDVDHWFDGAFATGWNLGDPNPSSNDDMLLTTRIIAEAHRAYGIDTRRVYTVGFSNGGFFAPFVAFRMPGQIAAFAEMGGGAIRCENRGNDQFQGPGTTCAALKTLPGYPHCAGPIKPAEVPAGRVPPGYLAHCNDDPFVSVAWSCTLADALGSHGEMSVCTGGHAVTADFAAKAWSFMSRHSLP